MWEVHVFGCTYKINVVCTWTQNKTKTLYVENIYIYILYELKTLKELFAFFCGCMFTLTTPLMASTHLPSSRPSSGWEWTGLANAGNARDLLPWPPMVGRLNWCLWGKWGREWELEVEEGRGRDDLELSGELGSNWKQLSSDATSLGYVFTMQNSTWHGSEEKQKMIALLSN